MMRALESQSIYRVVALSTTTPSIRTVVVEANAGWYRDDLSEGAKGDCTVYPVLALRTVVKNMYTKQVRQLPPREPLTHEELLKDGWTFALQFEQTSALIYDPEKCCILAYDDEDRSNQYNHRYAEVVVCPWPAKADEQRLAQVYEQVSKVALSLIQPDEIAVSD